MNPRSGENSQVLGVWKSRVNAAVTDEGIRRRLPSALAPARPSGPCWVVLRPYHLSEALVGPKLSGSSLVRAWTRFSQGTMWFERPRREQIGLGAACVQTCSGAGAPVPTRCLHGADDRAAGCHAGLPVVPTHAQARAWPMIRPGGGCRTLMCARALARMTGHPRESRACREADNTHASIIHCPLINEHVFGQR